MCRGSWVADWSEIERRGRESKQPALGRELSGAESGIDLREVLRLCEHEHQVPPPRVRVRPSGAGRDSDDGCRDAIPFCASRAISLRRCSVYAAFPFTMLPTAVAMSASDLPRTHPPVTSSV